MKALEDSDGFFGTQPALIFPLQVSVSPLSLTVYFSKAADHACLPRLGGPPLMSFICKCRTAQGCTVTCRDPVGAVGAVGRALFLAGNGLGGEPWVRLVFPDLYLAWQASGP